MRRSLIFGGFLYLLSGAQVWAQANVENPTANSTQSGISLISGWVCNATTIEVMLDSSTTKYQIPYGTPRGDTQSACGGKTNTGFGALINWNDLGDGPHVVQILADGQQIASIPITVVTFGTSFLRGESGTITGSFAGCRVALVWQESQQNFAIGQTDACFNPLLGQWEFVTKNPSGDERDHYSLERIVTEPVENDGVTEIQAVEGSDLDHGGLVALLRVSDLETPTSVPYTFFLASLFSSRCEVFFFSQTNATSVTGVGLSYPADPIDGCENIPSPTPTFYNMSGTKTGEALSTKEALQFAVPTQMPGRLADTSISPELLAELLKKTFQFAPRQQP